MNCRVDAAAAPGTSRPRGPSRSRPQRRHEVRVRQAAHVEHEVGVERHAVLEAEAEERDHQRDAPRRAPARSAMKLLRSSWTVRSDVSTISSASARICLQPPRSSRMPSMTGRPCASGCGRRVSLNRRTSASWLASRKISTGSSRGIALQLPQDARELAEEAALADVDDDAPPSAARRLRGATARQRRDQLRRQVVDAEVAEVLERANRLRLAGAGQAGEDDERAPRAGFAVAAPSAARPRAHFVSARRAASGARPSRALEPLGQRRARRDGPAPAAAGCAPRLRRGSRCCGRARPACG